MPEVIFRPGVQPNDPNRPRIYFEKFWNKDSTPPASVNYYGMPYIGMMDNDTLGDCVYACTGHLTEQQTYNGQGAEYEVADAAVLNAYEAWAGYVPGNPSTDQGDTIQHGLEWLLAPQPGYGGHLIAVDAQVNASNHAQVQTAISEFGAVVIGIEVYQSMMNEFNAGQPWTPPAGGQALGGHCVLVAGYDATYVYLYTWGAVQKATWTWWDSAGGPNTRGGECWVTIGTDWVSAATGLDPEGVNLYAYGQQYAAYTGQPNPFPATPPPPPPLLPLRPLRPRMT